MIVIPKNDALGIVYKDYKIYGYSTNNDNMQLFVKCERCKIEAELELKLGKPTKFKCNCSKRFIVIIPYLYDKSAYSGIYLFIMSVWEYKSKIKNIENLKNMIENNTIDKLVEKCIKFGNSIESFD